MSATATDSPAVVMQALSQLESDLEARQNEFEEAAGDAIRYKRDFELRKAHALVVAQGNNAAEREAHALIAVAAASDGIYESFKDAESRYAALKAAISVMDSRCSALQSVLRAQGRA